MKILKKDLKHGTVTIQVSNLDDLWYISQVIDQGDIVSSKTERKIKASTDENAKLVRKTVFLKIQVQQVDFKGEVLRVSGIVSEGTDLVPKGSHHTINFEVNAVASIIKEKWHKFQLDRLTEAQNSQSINLLLVVLDRENAIFSIIKNKGYEILSEFEGDVAKKGDDATKPSNFYSQISKTLVEYSNRFNAENIIVASPAFWKDDLLKVIDSSIKKKIVLAVCSSATTNAIEEVLKRPELKDVLEKQRTSKEAKIVEELMEQISKEGLSAYGDKEIQKAVDGGAIRILLVTTKKIKDSREENNFGKFEKLMKTVEDSKGDVFILNSDNEPGKKIDALGGVSALLRYKINY